MRIEGEERVEYVKLRELVKVKGCENVFVENSQKKKWKWKLKKDVKMMHLIFVWSLSHF